MQNQLEIKLSLFPESILAHKHERAFDFDNIGSKTRSSIVLDHWRKYLDSDLIRIFPIYSETRILDDPT